MQFAGRVVDLLEDIFPLSVFPERCPFMDAQPGGVVVPFHPGPLGVEGPVRNFPTRKATFEEMVFEDIRKYFLKIIMLTVVESIQTTQNLSTVVIPLNGDPLGGFLGGLFGGREVFGGFGACHLEQTMITT